MWNNFKNNVISTLGVLESLIKVSNVFILSKICVFVFFFKLQVISSLEKTLVLGKIEGRRRRGGWIASPF